MVERSVQAAKVAEAQGTPQTERKFAASTPLSLISAPPPISKVLHDVYEEETATN